MSIPFDRIASELLARADAFCRELFPAGRLEGKNYRIGNVRGDKGQSLAIDLTTGSWKDFASEDKGGDLISLYAAHHGMSQADAARALAPHLANGHDSEAERAVKRITSGRPAPSPPEVTDAAAIYRYTDTWYIARFEYPNGVKSFTPYTWDGSTWNKKAPPKPRPLFGLDDLAARPDATVLIVEGEKACLAARELLPGYVALTWAGGAQATGTADWEPLRGRRVDIWPDADDPGRAAAAALSVTLVGIGCAVQVVNTEGAPSDGWDIADALAAGWTRAELVAWGKPRLIRAKAPETVPETIDANDGLIPGTDISYGHRLYLRHGRNLHYTMERGWLVWSGQRWQIDDKAVGVAALAMESARSLFDDIKDSTSQAEAFKLAKLACQKRTIEAAMWLARAEPGIYQQLVTFDVDPMTLNVHNGIVDLRNGTLREHSREARCTMLAGTHFDPDAEAPRWRQFIGEVCCGDTDLMDYMQRVCGYLLTASVREHCLFFMHGAGRNGKSVMVEAIMRVMGDYAWAAEPEMLMAKKYMSIPVDVAALRGKRAVFLNETGQGQRFDEAKLKNLTGGDRLQARFMRENLFEFDPTHKLMLRGNHKPTVNGTDEGIWSRLKLIPFDLRLEVDEIDRRLPETLNAELPGILAWCVQGCLMWQSEGLTAPAVIEDAITDYRGESDTLGRFIEERCTLRANAQVKSSALYKAYRDFCETGGERYLSQKDFPNELTNRNQAITRERQKTGMRFSGIELNQTDESWRGYDN